MAMMYLFLDWQVFFISMRAVMLVAWYDIVRLGFLLYLLAYSSKKVSEPVLLWLV